MEIAKKGLGLDRGSATAVAAAGILGSRSTGASGGSAGERAIQHCVRWIEKYHGLSHLLCPCGFESRHLWASSMIALR
eukprot:2997394-Rhodomonas_salina.4